MLVDFWLLLVLQHHRPRPPGTVFTSYVLCEARYGVRSKLATTRPLSDNHDEKWQFQLPLKLVKWLCVGWLVAVAPLPAVCCPVACCHQAMSPHCLRCLKLGVIHRQSSSLQTVSQPPFSMYFSHGTSKFCPLWPAMSLTFVYEILSNNSKVKI